MGRRREDRAYVTWNKRFKLSAEEKDFLRRRTLPFFDRAGLDRPISHLLQEAYLQGLRDAVDVATSSPTPTPPASG